MSQYIADLFAKAALSPSRSGGKGAGLAWLSHQGFRVPPGFIITTDAFRMYAEAVDLKPENAVGAPGNTPTPAPLPPQIERSIRQAYQRLGGSVAVRSSLLAEDSAETSFAGQLESCLDIDGEERVLAAVLDCWASLCGARVAAYLEQNPQSARELVMALVVQRMIQATAAGVAFSADPLTGDARVIIEGAAGRGDAVVRGAVPADRYVVDGRGELVESIPLVPGQEILSPAQVQQLAILVREIERRAGSPQDVEWAWDGSEYHILQSRPITNLRHNHVYSRRVVGEMAPGLIKPMVYAVNVLPKGSQVFGRLFTELIGPSDVDYGKLVTLIYSRAYGDMTLMGELFTRAGLPPNLIEMMYQEERARGGKMRMSMGMMRPMGRLARFVAGQSRLADRAAQEIAARDAVLAPYRAAEWSGVSVETLITQLDRLTASRNEFFWLFFLITASMILRTGALKRWIGRQAPDVPFGDLIRGLSGLKGLEPMAEIERLAHLARQLPIADLESLSEADEVTIKARLAETDTGRELLARMDSFLESYGYLSSNGSDFSVPVWNENPTVIWRAVSRSAALPAIISTQNTLGIREEALRHVRKRFSRSVCPAFNRLFASAVTYIGLRERISLLISEYSYEMRRLFLAIGSRLTEAGCLEQPDDLFFITYEEMKGLVGGALTAHQASELIVARRAELAADAEMNPPDIVRADPARLRSAPTAESPASACLIGIGGSAGIAQGRARIIFDPAHAPAALDRQDILVVPYSDVGWTPLFPAVGGIVAETGGQLSHTAIVAREYGLPAVVSVKGAMHLIRDGQPLTVDGSRGHVYLEQVAA